jgi:hypothetical protein
MAARVKLGGVTPSSQTLVRMRYCLHLLTQMLPVHTIVEKCCDRFGCRERQARRYIEGAREMLMKTPPVDLELRREQMRAAFGIAYVECMAKGSHGPAVRALRELALLDGLYPDHAGTGSPFTGKGAEEGQGIADTEPDRVRERMAELMTKYADALKPKAKGPQA